MLFILGRFKLFWANIIQLNNSDSNVLVILKLRQNILINLEWWINQWDRRYLIAKVLQVVLSCNVCSIGMRMRFLGRLGKDIL